MRKESESLELKKSTSELKEAIISIASILNKHQKGELYFGITNDGKVIGQSINEKTLRDISQQISAKIEPKIFPKINEKEVEGKKCILIEFEGNNLPYYAYGRAYIRVADEDKLISAKELEKIILQKNKDKLRWDTEVCKGATLKDIDDALIARFIELAKESKRIVIKEKSKELVLRKLHLISEGNITNAGIILFGKDPSKFFDNNLVKCGRFKGVTKEAFIDMKDFNGNLFDNLDKGISFLKEHLRISAEIKGLLREEKWEIPIEALRETIINALIHRNYFENGFTYIKMYDSKIVIANPGKLPESLEIADLYKEHESDPKNPLLAKVFYYAGLIDAWGRGSLNIIEALTDEGLDKPIFEESGGSFRTIFKRSEGLKVTDRLVEKVGEKVGEKLTLNQQQILEFISKNQKISIIELSDKVGIATKNIEVNISKLKQKGLLKRIGPAKGGYWEVVEK